MVEFESYMMLVSLARKRAAAARGARAEFYDTPPPTQCQVYEASGAFCRRLSKSMLTWLGLQRFLNVPGHTLARQKTDYRPKSLQPNSHRFQRSRRHLA
jgi:hypothetical protein